MYAEDPANNFLPDIGTLKTYRRPQGNGIRVDDGFEQGMDIPFYYDPMIAKMITYAETRDAAIAKMIRAIDEYEITGLETTLGFCKFVMKHEAFTSGNFDTGFVEKYFTPSVLQGADDDEEAMLAAIVATNAIEEMKSHAVPKIENKTASLWKQNRS